MLKNINIGVLVSGGGTNLQSIIDAINEGYINNAKITAVISSNDKAYALKRAEQNNISGFVVRKRDYENTDAYDKAIIDIFEANNVELVLMAGFLTIVGERLVKKYEGKMMNIHPSLIPSFCGEGYYGLKVHEKVLEYGVKVTGATVHFVNGEPDAGPIIIQKAVEVLDNDTPEILQQRVMKESEQVIYKEAVKLFCENKLVIEGRIVKILKEELT